MSWTNGGIGAPAIVVCCVVAAGVVAPAAARADQTDYFGEDAPSDEITFQVEQSRTRKQRILVGGLFGGALAFGGIGLLFHLDSDEKSDSISAVGKFTGRTYDREVEDTRIDALRSRRLAITGYTFGGAMLIGTAVALFLTKPDSEVVTVGDGGESVSVAPMRGGFAVSKGWRF